MLRLQNLKFKIGETIRVVITAGRSFKFTKIEQNLAKDGHTMSSSNELNLNDPNIELNDL